MEKNHGKKLEETTIDELQKELDSIKKEKADMRKELNQTFETMNKKIAEARTEFDKELDNQALNLEQAIKDYREAIVELRSSKDSELNTTNTLTSKNVEFISELISVLNVSSMDEIPAEITRLIQLQADYNKLQQQLQKESASGNNSKNIKEQAVITKLTKLLKIWDIKNVGLNPESPLIPLLNSLNGWISLMTQPDFNQRAMDEAVHELLEVLNNLAESK